MACKPATAVALTLLLGVVIRGSAAASEPPPLVSVAKAVIREAAKVGMEEAGVRVLGPTAWRYFKQVFTPVWAELERRYPALALKDPKRSEVAVEQAVARLDTDRQLQNILVDGFKRLADGQASILVELNRINETLEANNRQLREANALTARVLDELQQLRRQRPTKELVKVDRFAEVRPATALVHWVTLLLSFEREVLSGVPSRQYTKILPYGPLEADSSIPIEPTTYTGVAGGAFEDDRGRTCRKVELGAYAFTDAGDLWERTSIYCLVSGRWERQRTDE